MNACINYIKACSALEIEQLVALFKFLDSNLLTILSSQSQLLLLTSTSLIIDDNDKFLADLVVLSIEVSDPAILLKP